MSLTLPGGGPTRLLNYGLFHGNILLRAQGTPRAPSVAGASRGRPLARTWKVPRISRITVRPPARRLARTLDLWQTPLHCPPVRVRPSREITTVAISISSWPPTRTSSDVRTVSLVSQQFWKSRPTVQNIFQMTQNLSHKGTHMTGPALPVKCSLQSADGRRQLGEGGPVGERNAEADSRRPLTVPRFLEGRS